MVSRTLLWQTRKKVTGTAAMMNVTAAAAPALATPPAVICCKANCKGLSCSSLRNMEPVLPHICWNWKIASVSQAGFTLGITILQKICHSVAPSSLADSIRESGSCSINCFIRYRPIPKDHAGRISAR